jgi:signal transduction histidine kinase
MTWKPGFKTKAMAGFGGMLVATVVVAAVGIFVTASSTAEATRVARREANEFLLTQRLRFKLERVVADGRGYLLFGEEGLLLRARASLVQAETTLKELDHHIQSRAARAELVGVTHAAGGYAAIMERAVKEREKDANAEVLQRFEAGLRSQRERLDAAVEKLWAEQSRALEEGLEAVSASARRAGWLIVATATTALLLSLALARGFVGELSDLYEREGEAARAARRAVQSRDEMLAIIAHDLRSPLTAIRMQTGLLRRKAAAGGSGGPLRKQADSIDSTAARMEHLITDLLDAATIESGRFAVKPESCEVQALLETTREMFDPIAGHKAIHLEVEPVVNGLMVWADRDRVLQVLSNLVSNAVKFTPEGGVISVKAGAAEGGVRIDVIDTGPGIADEHRPHLFDRFWRADGAGRKGAGLGLYIAKGIVEASCGKIGVESRVAQGSTFFFTLPSSSNEIPAEIVGPRLNR